MNDITLEHPAQRCRVCFEATLAGHRAECAYRRQGDVLVLHHTAVPDALQGQGVAAALVAHALGWARQQGLRVQPTCSYVAAYMRVTPKRRICWPERERQHAASGG
jgi:predicted GNAT family acetyltransferase